MINPTFAPLFLCYSICTIDHCFRTLTEDDILRYEGVTKDDIINAFASVNSLKRERTQKPHSMDIESYTQDVYEPGYVGSKLKFIRTFVSVGEFGFYYLVRNNFEM